LTDNDEILRVALRVLTAIYEPSGPEPEHVNALRRYAPALADGPIDLLAREVILSFIESGRGYIGSKVCDE
jgi:hypothetical protein